MLSFCSGQPLQRLAAHPHTAPLVQKLGPHRLVKIDGRRIPVQNSPLQAQTASFFGNGRHLQEQSLADPQAAQLRFDEEILQIDSRFSGPGRVVEKIEGKSRRAAVVLGYQAEKKWVIAESILFKVRFGGDGGLRRALVSGQ